MPKRSPIDWSALTNDGYPPRGDVDALLDGIAGYVAPPGRENEWSGWEFPYQDLIAETPELVPHLIPLLLDIADRTVTGGKWRLLSLVMETLQPGWKGDPRLTGQGLEQRIRSAFLAGQPVYLSCLNDPEPPTRMMAVCALGECATGEAVAALRDRLPGEQDIEVRRYLRSWMKHAGVPPEDPIFRAVPEEPPWVPPPRDPDDDIPF